MVAAILRWGASLRARLRLSSWPPLVQRYPRTRKLDQLSLLLSQHGCGLRDNLAPCEARPEDRAPPVSGFKDDDPPLQFDYGAAREDENDVSPYPTFSNTKPFKYSVSGIIGMIG